MKERQRKLLFRAADYVMLFLAVSALGSLIIEYGFYISTPTRQLLHYIDYIILSFFILHDFLKLFLMQDSTAFVRSNWLNFIFFGVLLLVILLYNPWWQIQPFSHHLQDVPLRQIAKFYIVITQLYILLIALLSALRMGRRFIFTKIRPMLLIFGSFALIILIGAGLLLLPKSTAQGQISLIDALFTSTSAVCVTGLIVVDTGTYFSLSGQWIILLLMQAGGLGIMTMAALFTLISGANMSIRERLVLRDLISEENMEKISQTLWQILALTLLFEGIGLTAFYNSFPENAFSGGERLFTSLFHAVSGFCNAGFSTFSDSLVGFSDNLVILGTFSLLIIAGGLGFPVLVNLFSHRFSERSGPLGKKQIRMNIQTQVVLRVSTVLIITGALWIWFSQFALQGIWLPSFKDILASFFQSVTARTAGFNTIDIGALSVPTLLGIMVLMFIGASPASTGGGVKTTTFYLTLRSLWGHLTGKQEVEYRFRTLPVKILQWSLLLVLASQVVVGVCFLLLTIVEPMAPIDLLFESISAFGTVGLSTGITPELSGIGKSIIIVTMYLGRLGPLAFIIVLSRRSQRVKRYRYPEETLMIG